MAHRYFSDTKPTAAQRNGVEALRLYIAGPATREVIPAKEGISFARLIEVDAQEAKDVDQATFWRLIVRSSSQPPLGHKSFEPLLHRTPRPRAFISRSRIEAVRRHPITTGILIAVIVSALALGFRYGLALGAGLSPKCALYSALPLQVPCGPDSNTRRPDS